MRPKDGTTRRQLLKYGGAGIIGAGLLGLGVLGYMVWDCVRRRSTQSATGILYIAMIFAYFGELSAAELARTYGLWV